MAYLEGRLRGHTGGSEGEHAGHVLEVEVDMSAVEDAKEMADEQVAATTLGELAEGVATFPSEGPTLVLIGHALDGPSGISVRTRAQDTEQATPALAW